MPREEDQPIQALLLISSDQLPVFRLRKSKRRHLVRPIFEDGGTKRRLVHIRTYFTTRARKLYGSRKARWSPYWSKLWTIFGIASLAGPAKGRTGALNAVRRFVVAVRSSSSSSEILIEVNRPGDSSALLKAATGLPSMNLVVSRISDRPAPQNGSM